MLQPRRTSGLIWLAFLALFINCITGEYTIDSSPRRRRQNGEDVTTVLLVDSQGRSTFGRFLSVKPDLGLLTSTARTFIQEGVTTEYATQVLGTTLDNGRLYAHLLTKSSRVLYDNDAPTRSYSDQSNKKWNIDNNLINSNSVNFVKNTDYISPNQVEPFIVFPTTKPKPYKYYEPEHQQPKPYDASDEILKSSSSNNERVPFADTINNQRVSYSVSTSKEPKYITLGGKGKQSNIKVFQINPQLKDVHFQNAISYKDSSENDIPKKGDLINPSKVREWDNLPTFTVRNEFSPSGYSFLGDFPDFEVSTEKSKPTTVAERKAKLLFRAGLPERHELKTVTYTGFADFTTTVGDTVIIFSPSTSEVAKPQTGHVTKITGEATLAPSSSIPRPSKATVRQETIRPTQVVSEAVASTLTTQEPEEDERDEEDEEEETEPTEKYSQTTHSTLTTMVLDAVDRPRGAVDEDDEQHEDLDAKSAVLAHEQKGYTHTPQLEDTPVKTSEESVTAFSSDVIEPSESQTPMLSTPSHEDIAKILASLQAQANKATEPLNTPSTVFFDDEPASTPSLEKETQIFSGATTVFFDDGFQSTPLTEQPTTSKAEDRATTIPPTTTEEQTETTTTERVTTQNAFTTQKEPTTNGEIMTREDVLSTIPMQETTPEITNEIETEKANAEETDTENQDSEDGVETDVVCTEGEKIVPTTVYRTLTYLTTFFIQDELENSTSIAQNQVVSTEIGFQTLPCGEAVTPSAVDETVQPTVATTTEEHTTAREEAFASPKLEPTTEQLTTVDGFQETTPMRTTPKEITTERRHVTESDGETTEFTTESGEELELLFKTLYTTYNYLTTYFYDNDTSISTRKEIITNVVTSTINPAEEMTDPAVAGLLNKDSSHKSRPISFEEFGQDIEPSKVKLQPTAQFAFNADDDGGGADEDLSRPTPALSPNQLLQTASGLKTYYTTYTYFTTIFDEGETKVSSRTEVHTNYVTPSIEATPVLDVLRTTVQPDATTESDEQVEPPDTEDETDVKNKILNMNLGTFNKYNSTISRQKTKTPEDQTDLYDSSTDSIDNNILTTPSNQPSYTTLQRGSSLESSESNFLDLSEYETIATMVTDVRSSTSEGDRKIIDNLDKRNVLDDQIVSESNNDSEILPSPTLLLQTSYTTFTYFTTMYHGTTSSNVVSRLETVTNVVTETLTPTHSLSVDDLTLPITYFTTFTYWTTLYKQGTTKITSREETVSNIVTPSPALTSAPTLSISPTTEPSIDISPTPVQEVKPTSYVGDDDLTTFYTTYTYYSTTYVGNSSVVNSRLETSTNVINATADIGTNQLGRAIGAGSQNTIETEVTKSTERQPVGLLSTVVSTLENPDATTIFSTNIFGTYIDGQYAQVLDSTSSIITTPIKPTKAPEQPVKPTGVVSINQGKIVDAEGVSTLFYTTQAVGTYIDSNYAQVIESTSSLVVDSDKKSTLPTDLPVHRTGLVRLIEGSIVQNDTTTLYQSKVLGTVIEGRYAQVIESTSSFIVGKPSPTTASDVAPTPTKAPDEQIQPTTTPIAPSPVVIESSLSDTAKPGEESTTEPDEEDKEDDGTGNEKNSRVKSRLTYQSKKNTYSPVIRPFSSRPTRPTFTPFPKRKSATTITRSDFTPTVTVVPASTQRFRNRNKTPPSAVIINPTASGRRFAKPKTSLGGGAGPSSSSFGGGRGRSSSRIQPTAVGFGSSSRRGGFRSSGFPAAGNVRASSLYNGNRPRIRPTPAIGLNRFGSSASTSPAYSDDENELTTLFTENPTGYTDEDGDQTLPTTTEVSRRSQNPLLSRFRSRPPLSRPTTPRSASKSTGRNNKSGNRATTTTARPRSYSRPPALLNRPRPINGLLPRRNLFTTTTPSPDEDFEDDEDLADSEGEEGELDDDTDYDGSNTDVQTEPPQEATRKGRSFAGGPVQIRPFFRRRTKRQINYSRFRRPGARTTTTTKEPEPATEATKPPRTSKQNRFANRRKTEATTQAPKRFSPTKASAQGRSQFTLRDSSNRSNFRRPTPASNSRRTTTSSRPKAPRLRGTQTESTVRKSNQNKSNSRSRPTSRRGSTSRSRQYNSAEQVDNNFVLPSFDGTITVTHQIPTEVTIPIVNGKVTEYKNIITAKYSTEVLGPQQYTTSVNSYGKDVTVLLAESTGIGNNGATQITQFLLNETPTTSVIFTPTYIRGRKTSYSHVVPSTVYAVEEVVNTIQPALAAQAPLANILLSQLLLGNFQQPNPLLGFQNPAMPATPTTEYKTRSTTYVTTVTSATSTVIPLTFRGKEILTTIVDSSVEVITATEFITDTVVVTPTPGFTGGNQLNSLLVPLLLQQQQQQPVNPLLQQPAGVINLAQEQPLAQALRQEALDNYNVPIDENKAIEDEGPEKFVEEATQPPKRKSRKKPRKPAPTPPPKETSVVTLYVSGRQPGEFTTVLSTYVVGEDNRRKREAMYIPVRPSAVLENLKTQTVDFDALVMPTAKEVRFETDETSSATESLESVLGDVTKHIVTETPDLPRTKPTKTANPSSKKYVAKAKTSKCQTQKSASGSFLAL